MGLPNRTPQPTGAAVTVFPGFKLLEAAPADELGRQAEVIQDVPSCRVRLRDFKVDGPAVAAGPAGGRATYHREAQG